MPDLEFPSRPDPDALNIPPGDMLTINTDPQYDGDGTVLIGMWQAGEYHSVELNNATALRFADAIRAKIATAS